MSLSARTKFRVPKPKRQEDLLPGLKKFDWKDLSESKNYLSFQSVILKGKDCCHFKKLQHFLNSCKARERFERSTGFMC